MKKTLYTLLLTVSTSLAFAKTVYIAPYSGAKPEIFYNLYSNPDEINAPWYYLRKELIKEGYKVKITYTGKKLKNLAALVSINQAMPNFLKNISAYPQKKKLLVCLEPPVVLPHLYKKKLLNHYGKVFVMLDDLVANSGYHKIYYPQVALKKYENLPNFKNKKLCTMIATNWKNHHAQELYSQRRVVAKFFEGLEEGEIDIYGNGWQGFKNWKGHIVSKREVLKNYNFGICYENTTNQVGYITEKIFDCFVCGCIPIYWGASNITDYVPKECFIDRRDFDSDKEVYDFIKKMDETTYKKYMTSITTFLASDAAKLYSVQNFVSIIIESIKKM